MKEIPILFSTPMVQAILEGRKSQTRRIVKPQPVWSVDQDGNLYEGNHKGYVKVDGHPDWPRQFACQFAKWKKDNILWVRETWSVGSRPDPFQGSVDGIEFKADSQFIDDIESLPLHQFEDFDYGNYDKSGWRSSIHMPKSIARIWLQVTDVRVERLQDISEEDAKAEGIEKRPGSDSTTRYDYKHYHWDHWYNVSAQVSYRTLWEKINGPDSWQANPFCWVVSFKVLSTTGKPK